MTRRIPVDRLKSLQKLIASKAVIQDLYGKPLKKVAGVDVAYNRSDAYAAIVVLELPTLNPVDEYVCKGKPPIPYIPGLLAFREGPLMLKALKGVREGFQVALIDGHGIAHPLRCGLATYVGVLSGKPTVGVAKSLLVGSVEAVPRKPLESRPVRLNGDVIGYCLRSKSLAKPIYVSPGNLVSVRGSLEVVIASLRGYRIPEPLRLAHMAAGKARAEQRSF